MMPQIMTVRGPIDPAGLGITLAHEHVLIDLTCLWEQGHEEWQRSLTDALPTLRNRGLLYRDPYVSRPNLRLDEIEVAAAELRLYRDLGGRSLIDMTTHGIDPRPEQLRRLSSTTGVQIVMGCGFYVQCAHPPGLSTMSV
ncbi:MAG: phosphotriesterase-related protein, partial [Chloroflexota bacterium]|nr:phosphotriesterase-related protein [Chloroflexota bacterium]